MKNTPIILAAFALLLALAPTARADLNELNVKGKVIQIGPQTIEVQTDAGEKWLASLDPNRFEDGVNYTGIPEPKVEISGTDTADILRAGMYIRFEADVEKKKTIKGAVSEVTVIGPGKDNVYGLLPSGPGGDGGGTDADSERMVVVGKLTAANRMSISISFLDGKHIKAKLAPGAVVKIASNDLELIRPGDDVELKGRYLKAPRVFATGVVVNRVAKPEKGPRKPAAPAKPEVTAGKKPKAGDAAPAFGEGDPRDPKIADKPADKPAAPTKAGTPGKILKVN